MPRPVTRQSWPSSPAVRPADCSACRLRSGHSSCSMIRKSGTPSLTNGNIDVEPSTEFLDLLGRLSFPLPSPARHAASPIRLDSAWFAPSKTAGTSLATGQNPSRRWRLMSPAVGIDFPTREAHCTKHQHPGGSESRRGAKDAVTRSAAVNHSSIVNGLHSIGFATRPLRIRLTGTKRRTTLPSSTTRILCRFWRNRRRVMPVVLRPLPPRYLALPRLRDRVPEVRLGVSVQSDALGAASDVCSSSVCSWLAGVRFSGR